MMKYVTSKSDSVKDAVTGNRPSVYDEIRNK